jgi:hypothetical protein
MYGLQPGMSFEFLVGATLQQVSVGRHQVILSFDDAISISVESSLAIERDGWSQRYDDLVSGASELVGLLECSIDSASGAPDGTLSVQFSNGSRLSIFDTSKQFESYQIQSVFGLIVV